MVTSFVSVLPWPVQGSVVSDGWVKGNQVIYLATYQNPSQSTTYLLAIYLLTK